MKTTEKIFFPDGSLWAKQEHLNDLRHGLEQWNKFRNRLSHLRYWKEGMLNGIEIVIRYK